MESTGITLWPCMDNTLFIDGNFHSAYLERQSQRAKQTQRLFIIRYTTISKFLVEHFLLSYSLVCFSASRRYFNGSNDHTHHCKFFLFFKTCIMVAFTIHRLVSFATIWNFTIWNLNRWKYKYKICHTQKEYTHKKATSKRWKQLWHLPMHKKTADKTSLARLPHKIVNNYI